MNLPCSFLDLIPQKGKMGFEGTLLAIDEKNGEGTMTVKPGNIFLNDRKELSNAALIEFVNQLSAAVQGYNEKFNGIKTFNGLFVGVQEAEFFKTVGSGDLLRLKGVITEEVSQVTFIEGLIETGGETAAKLVTKVYRVRSRSEFESLTGGLAAPKDAGFKNTREAPACLSSVMRRKLFSYIIEKSACEGGLSFKFACPQDFEAFDGHFPGNPILPGVALLETGNMALELIMNRPVTISYIKRMKIAGAVLPGNVVSCDIKTARDGDGFSFTAQFRDAVDREISRFNGRFR